jgi:maleate cis-trans isomerase
MAFHIFRRRFLQSAAALTLGAHPARAAAQHIVGCIKPLAAPPPGVTDETNVELMQLLPHDIGILPDYVSLTKGTKSEMRASLATYEKLVASLASRHVDLISIEGAPPFMLIGRQAETTLIRSWQQKYKTPMFTSPQNQVNAFKAVGARKIYGVTEFTGSINKTYADYFVSAGYNIFAMQGIPGITFDQLHALTGQQIYDFIKLNLPKNENVDVIYLLGSAGKTLNIIEQIERDFDVTVIHPVAARAWEFQARLGSHRPVNGYGKLLATLPPFIPS